MKNTKYFIVVVAILLVAILAVSYSWFRLVAIGDANDQVVTTGTLSIKYEDGPEIIAENLIPGDSVTKTFTVENTGSLDAQYKIIWKDLINTFENNELIYTLILDGEEFTDIIPAQDDDLKTNISIASGEVHEYTLTITFIETGAPQDYNQSKQFATTLQVLDGAASDLKLTLKVDGSTVESVPEDGYYDLVDYSCEYNSTIKWNAVKRQLTTLTSGSRESCVLEFESSDEFLTAILRDNEVQSDSSINFGAVSSDTNGKGLYKTSNLTRTADIDGDGTGEEVYYFRGAVDNNYVLFADFCWRIVRTNEDGSIKLRYGGVQNEYGNCPITGTSVQISSTAFNTTYNAAKYVGYMYDTNTSSTAKTTIDNWYSSNIANKGEDITSLVVDTPYCNDTTTHTPSNATSGYTYYGAYGRLITNKTPQYKCPRTSDAYTVNSSNGNGKLTHPVGLLTADEVAYAGGLWNTANSSYYLYTGGNYWTMSPYYFYGSIAYEFAVYSSGYLNDYRVNYTSGLLPAVSLKADAIAASGTGTFDNPYIVTKN